MGSFLRGMGAVSSMGGQGLQVLVSFLMLAGLSQADPGRQSAAYSDAEKCVASGEYGRAYGILEKALRENEATWTPTEKMQAKLALASLWIKTSPLSMREAGQKTEDALRLVETDHGSSGVLKALEGDSAGAAAEFQALVEEWESLGQPEPGRERAELARLASGICLCLTGQPEDADQGLVVLEAMAGSSSASNEIRKGALHAGAALTRYWKREDAFSRLSGALQRTAPGLEPGPAKVLQSLDVLLGTPSGFLLSDVPDPWNPVSTGLSVYVTPFVRTMAQSSDLAQAQAECQALIQEMAKEGQFQMGLLAMERGDYPEAIVSFESCLGNGREDARKEKALAKIATSGVKMGTNEGLTKSATALLKSFDFSHYGGAIPVLGDLLSWAYADAKTKADQAIQADATPGNDPGHRRIQHLRMIRSALKRAGSLGDEDIQGAFDDLQAVLDETPLGSETQELALYVASQMTRTFEFGSERRGQFEKLGHPGEKFKAKEAVARALDELLEQKGSFKDSPDWQEFVSASVDFAEGEIGRYEEFLKGLAQKNAAPSQGQ